MNDYRLLFPALVFWVVRIGGVEPSLAVSILAVILVLILYLASIEISARNLPVTLAGIVLAVIFGISVNLILPLSEYDAKNYLATAAEDPAEISGEINWISHPSRSLELFLSPIRINFRRLTQNYAAETAGILNGVILGDESLIPDSLTDQVRLAGLQHLVAISGAHISLLIGVAIFLFGRRKPKLTATLAALFLLLLVALVGLSASVLRASLMGVIALVALACRKGSNAIAALSVGIILGVTFWPLLVQGAGFQMSVLATAAIIIFGSQITKLPEIAKHSSLRFLIIPLVAGTAVIPVSAQFQAQLSVLATLANIVVAPVIPMMTVLGLLACIFSPIFPSLASLLLIPCAVGAWWISRIAAFVASISWLNTSPWIIAGIQLCGLIGIVIWAKTKSKRELSKVHFPLRREKILSLKRALVWSIATGCVFSFLVIPRGIRAVDGFSWELIQCDVGQGAALLARKAGQTVLIDTGTAKNNALSCLRRNGVAELDLLILSHLDSDHSGGFEQVAQKVKIGQIWLSENTHPQQRYKQIMQCAAALQLIVKYVRAGTEFAGWLKVISPQKVRGTAEETNTDSLVLDLHLQTQRVLVLSDVPALIQDSLAQMQLGQFSCVIVAHHGAKSQSRQLAAQVKPQISLISVGKNKYGHPHKNALQVWKAPLLKTTKACGDIRIGATEYETQKQC